MVDVMEIIADVVTLSAANTATETEIDMPVSMDERRSVMLSDVWFNSTRLDSGNTALDNIETFLNKESGSHGMNDDEHIAEYGKTVIAADNVEISGRQHWKFDPPLLIVSPKLFLRGVAVGQAGATNHYVKMGYQIKTLSKDQFVEALLSL